ncbi:MAG: hypothetical protein H6Q55_1265 [Deltaproteobacteria bacterium]|jgi:hypothetical protein|nr:hypothetical protein [Deltaproteobacteria bacterium]
MSIEIKVYKVKDFIRLNESGEIDFARSMQLIHNLAMAASFYSGHNILIDFRETTLAGEIDMSTILRLALEMARYESTLKGRIANVLPNDEKRLSIAKQFKASLDLQGFQYEIFTNFEDAIDWLSEVTDLGESDD